MKRYARLLVPLVAPAAVALAGCGGGGEGGSETSPPATSTGLRRPHKGGDNSVQTYGAEASGSARAEAATVLQTYLDVRADGDWAKACLHLAGPASAQLRQFASADKGGASCVDAMKALTEGVPESALRQAATIDEVLSLRLQGDRGFLLFNGPPKTTLYEMPMVLEGGDWKIGAIAASASPV